MNIYIYGSYSFEIQITLNEKENLSFSLKPNQKLEIKGK